MWSSCLPWSHANVFYVLAVLGSVLLPRLQNLSGAEAPSPLVPTSTENRCASYVKVPTALALLGSPTVPQGPFSPALTSVPGSMQGSTRGMPLELVPTSGPAPSTDLTEFEHLHHISNCSPSCPQQILGVFEPWF